VTTSYYAERVYADTAVQRSSATAILAGWILNIGDTRAPTCSSPVAPGCEGPGRSTRPRASWSQPAVPKSERSRSTNWLPALPAAVHPPISSCPKCRDRIRLRLRALVTLGRADVPRKETAASYWLSSSSLRNAASRHRCRYTGSSGCAAADTRFCVGSAKRVRATA